MMNTDVSRKRLVTTQKRGHSTSRASADPRSMRAHTNHAHYITKQTTPGTRTSRTKTAKRRQQLCQTPRMARRKTSTRRKWRNHRAYEAHYECINGMQSDVDHQNSCISNIGISTIKQGKVSPQKSARTVLHASILQYSSEKADF